MRDPIAIVEAAVDIAAIGKRVRLAHVALRDAEGIEQRTAESAAKARDEAARRRLELGRALVEARKAWPARGPKAKGWGDFLRDAGIAEQSAREWMRLAGYVDEVSKPDGDGLEIPTRREVQEAKRPAPPPIIDVTAEAEEDDEAEEAPPEKPAKAPRVYTDDERAKIRQADIQRFQPPKMETREERTARLVKHLHEAETALDALRAAGLHLTDATTGDGDFELAKRSLIAIVRFGIDELEGAGVLDAPPPQKRQLLILAGGKPA